MTVQPTVRFIRADFASTTTAQRRFAAVDSSMVEYPHVSIIGAGAVGVAVATSILHGRFAPRLSLFDINADKAHGEAMDLAHAAPLLGNANVTGGGMAEVTGGDICIITAGVKQRPGEDRLALLTRNCQALDEIATTLESQGLPRVVIMVSNPVDLMTEVMRRRLAPKGVAVLGSGTLLDTLRLRYALSRLLSMAPSSIHVSVVGEHGNSSVSLLDSGRAGGLPLAQMFEARNVHFDDAHRASLAADVRGAAFEIIARKGATSHAIGVAVARIVQAIATDERVVLPVSAVVEPGLCAGVPCLLGRYGATPLPWPLLSTREQQALDQSLGILRASLQTLDASDLR